VDVQSYKKIGNGTLQGKRRTNGAKAMARRTGNVFVDPLRETDADETPLL
jgi:hypothetical protein